MLEKRPPTLSELRRTLSWPRPKLYQRGRMVSQRRRTAPEARRMHEKHRAMLSSLPVPHWMATRMLRTMLPK
jgi:hypothetical protein